MSGNIRTKKYEIDMCNGPILGKLLLFALPLMCSGILQLLFNAADIIVVGRFAGDNSLAAVGATTSLINLLTNFFIGLSIGANVLVAHFFGANQKKDLKDTVHTAMLLSIYGGILLTVIGCFFARTLLSLMQTPAEVLDLAVLYLRIYFLGMTATTVYNFGSAILRAVGDTRRPLYYLAIAGVINVVLNVFFVVKLHMDVAGVGTATAISQCVSAFFVIRCLMKEQSDIHLELKQLHLDKTKFIKILKIGFPAGLQGMLFSFSNVIIQSAVNSFGAIVVAGNSAAANLEGFVYVAMNAFYQGSLSFTSQNVGAMKYGRINRILITAETCVLTVGVLLGNTVYFFGRELLALYSPNPAVVDAGMVRLSIICTLYALCGMMDTVVGSLRGLGHSIVPMLVSLVGACGLRLFWIFTFFRLPQFHSMKSLYFTYPVTWTLTFLTHVVCFIIIRRKYPKTSVE